MMSNAAGDSYTLDGFQPTGLRSEGLLQREHVFIPINSQSIRHSNAMNDLRLSLDIERAEVSVMRWRSGFV